MVSVEKEINRLQNNLQAIRKVAGWTTQELGDMVGVTKQTISNIENKRTTLTKTQYIALRTVIDYEIASRGDDTTLAQVVQVLLMPEEDEGSDVEGNNGQEKGCKKDGAKVNAATAATAVTAVTLGTIHTNPLLLGLTAEWLSKIIKRK